MRPNLGRIIKNPILLVKMPDKRQFPQKEIRFFNQEECMAIAEEAGRTYSNGKPIYVYAEAFILMLNTGIRMGEAIGLEKQDWDSEAKTLHIRRNFHLFEDIDHDAVAQPDDLF